MPDNIDRNLEAAGRALQEGRAKDAIATYLRMMEIDRSSKGVAAYCLGLVYDGGLGVPKDKDAALRYYTLADAEGYELGTYRLGHMLLVRDESAAALAKFKSIAKRNPSAAYWIYRVMAEVTDRRGAHREESERYLAMAASEGHVLAKRVYALRRLRDEEGILKIPGGLLEVVGLVFYAAKLGANGEKLLYE